MAKKIAIVVFVFSVVSCGSMRDVRIYEPSKSVSQFEQFPYKTLFKEVFYKDFRCRKVLTAICIHPHRKENN